MEKASADTAFIPFLYCLPSQLEGVGFTHVLCPKAPIQQKLLEVLWRPRERVLRVVQLLWLDHRRRPESAANPDFSRHGEVPVLPHTRLEGEAVQELVAEVEDAIVLDGAKPIVRGELGVCDLETRGQVAMVLVERGIQGDYLATVPEEEPVIAVALRPGNH